MKKHVFFLSAIIIVTLLLTCEMINYNPKIKIYNMMPETDIDYVYIGSVKYENIKQNDDSEYYEFSPGSYNIIVKYPTATASRSTSNSSESRSWDAGATAPPGAFGVWPETPKPNKGTPIPTPGITNNGDGTGTVDISCCTNYIITIYNNEINLLED